MKIIFLDIDGVLVNGHSARNCGRQHKHFWHPAESCVEALNRVIRETGAVVCVSSTWRLGETVEGLQEMLTEWGVVCDVIGKTPHLWHNACRGDEILDWLREYVLEAEVESYVIIDDDVDMGELCDHLVRTGFDPGLTEADADACIELLSKHDSNLSLITCQQ